VVIAGEQAVCGKKLQMNSLCLAAEAKSLCEISGIESMLLTQTLAFPENLSVAIYSFLAPL